MGKRPNTYWKHLKYLDLYNGNPASTTLSRTIDRALFDDDACPDIPNIAFIYPKLLLYNNIDGKNPRGYNRKDPTRQKQKDITKTKILLSNLPDPYTTQ